MEKKELIKKIRKVFRDAKKENKDVSEKEIACFFVVETAIAKAKTEKTKEKREEAVLLTVSVLLMLLEQEMKVNVGNEGVNLIAELIKKEAPNHGMPGLELNLPTREEIMESNAITHYKDALASILYNFDQIKESNPAIKLAKATISVVENILFNDFSDRSIIEDFLEEMPTFVGDNISMKVPDDFYEGLQRSIRFSVFLNDTGNELTVKEVLEIAKKDYKGSYESLKKMELDPSEKFGKAISALKEKAEAQMETKRRRPKRKISLKDMA